MKAIRVIVRTMECEETFMRRAIDVARRGILAGQSPFGAVVVRDGVVVAEAHNTVLADGDPTGHAEVRAIRAASRALETIDLSRCTIYSTCEPCPMCFGAIHWARIARIVSGARIADAERAGFHELRISNAMLRDVGGSPVTIVPGCLAVECAALFDEWQAGPSPRRY